MAGTNRGLQPRNGRWILDRALLYVALGGYSVIVCDRLAGRHRQDTMRVGRMRFVRPAICHTCLLPSSTYILNGPLPAGTRPRTPTRFLPPPSAPTMDPIPSPDLTGEMPKDDPPQRRRNYLVGIGLLMIVVLLWTSSNFIIQVSSGIS